MLKMNPLIFFNNTGLKIQVTQPLVKVTRHGMQDLAILFSCLSLLLFCFFFGGGGGSIFLTHLCTLFYRNSWRDKKVYCVQ